VTRPVDHVEQALMRHGCNPRNHTARCPAHDDSSPSLSFNEGGDGRALIHCHAGCTPQAIVDALGIRIVDLFGEQERQHQAGHIDAVYPYYDDGGELLYEVVRIEPKTFRQRRPDGHGGYHWNLQGVTRVPYRLPQLLDGIARGDTIWVVEGEKDAETLAAHGHTATCNSGGAGKWTDDHARWLTGAAQIVVVADNDAPGYDHARQVAATLHGAPVALKRPPDGYKDISDVVARHGTLEVVDLDDPDDQPPPGIPDIAVAPFLVNYGELWAKEAHAEDWLCEPLFARSRGHAIYAGAKTGKSLLTLYIAACIATGRACLNRPAGDPIKVLYLDYEMTEDDLRERLEQFGFGPDDAELLQANLHYALLPSLPPLNTAEGGKAIVGSASALDVELVIIDTTARAVDGDENDADTYRALYRHTGLWLKQAGIAYARLDHAGKDVEKGQRGSSAKNDDVDVVWRMIRRDDQALRLTATHRRMSWVPQEVDVATVEEDGTSRFTTAPSSTPEGTKAVIDALDAAGAPVDVTSRQAAEIARNAGVKARNAVIRAAIKHRRQSLETLGQPVDNPVGKRAPIAGRAVSDGARPDSGARRGANSKTPSQRPGAVRGAVGRAGSDHRAPFVPPVGGHTAAGAPGTPPKPPPRNRYDRDDSYLFGDPT